MATIETIKIGQKAILIFFNLSTPFCYDKKPGYYTKDIDNQQMNDDINNSKVISI